MPVTTDEIYCKIKTFKNQFFATLKHQSEKLKSLVDT
jgi:hypothetical protein